MGNTSWNGNICKAAAAFKCTTTNGTNTIFNHNTCNLRTIIIPRGWWNKILHHSCSGNGKGSVTCEFPSDIISGDATGTGSNHCSGSCVFRMGNGWGGEGCRSGGGACQDERCQNGGGGTLDCMFHKIHPSIKKSAGYQFLGKLRSGVVCNFLTSKLFSQKSGPIPTKRCTFPHGYQLPSYWNYVKYTSFFWKLQ